MSIIIDDRKTLFIHIFLFFVVQVLLQFDLGTYVIFRSAASYFSKTFKSKSII